MSSPAIHQFILPNTRQSIKPSVMEVLDFIDRHLPTGINKEAIRFKAEVIIIELLTNGIKHAGSIDTFLEVAVDGQSICIDKKDFGNRYYPGDITSLLVHDVGYKTLLSKDGLHSMYAVVENENRVRFFFEEMNDDVPLDISNMMEHFGLLIITKSADDFTYQYDIESGLNTFSVQIQLS